MFPDTQHTVPPNEAAGGDIVKALAEADRARHGEQSAGQWLKANLFSTVSNTIITLVFGTIGLLVLFLLARFVLITAEWEPTRANIQLLLTGRFPRSETTRLIVQVFAMAGGIGLLVGYRRERALAEAKLAGTEIPTTPLGEIASIYWAVTLMVIVVMVICVGTFRPWLILAGAVLAGGCGYLVSRGRSLRIVSFVATLVPFVLAGGILSFIPDLANGPAYLIAGCATALLLVVRFTPRPRLTLSIGAVFVVGAFQVLSGTAGLSWMYLTIAAVPAVLVLVDELDGQGAWLDQVGALVFAGGTAFYTLYNGLNQSRMLVLAIGLAIAIVVLVGASGGQAGNGRQLGLLAVVALIMWQLGRLIGLEGISWEVWGGLQLNLVISAASIALAFPIGLLLALGRRSSLPVMRVLCTSYIELIRGVPLISLLLIAQLFIGFFLSSGNNSLSLTTKSLIVITMFSSAYIAEIVRGGLQAVPQGQTEAGQAMGLSPAKITRLLVLPQALRAVVPAMVGQFISLFKDTSLLSIIGVLEFLGVRKIIHTQDLFRAVGRVETLVFAAFVFWAISFTMSRESQRLERRLDVGAR